MKRLLVSVLAAFPLALAAQTMILSETFSSGSLPSGWDRTQNSPSAGWEFGSSLGSTYFPIPAHGSYAASNDDAHDDNSTTLNKADRDRLITPSLNLSSYTNVGLKFASICPTSYGSTQHIEASTDGGTTWTNVYTIPASTAWTDVTVDLSAYAGLAAVKFCFRHNDNNYWANGFALDDVEVFAPSANDGENTSLDVSPYVAIGTVPVTGIFTNKGSTPVTSFGLAYSIDGGAPVTTTISTGSALAFNDTLNYTHSTPMSFASAGNHVVKVWVTVGGDANHTNDTITLNLSVLTAVPTKYVVLEDHTGAWCQFCPDGTVVMEQVLDANPNVIGVAVHNGDMMDSASTAWSGYRVQSEYISGFPGGMIDHYKFPDQSEVQMNRGDWSAYTTARGEDVVPVSVSLSNVNWNASTRTVTARVTATFYGDVSNPDLRLNFWVTSDSLYGSGTGWNQVNYYNTVSGHPYFGAGNPITGFRHRHTLLTMVGGPWGTPGVVPTTVTAGSTYSYDYSVVIPTKFWGSSSQTNDIDLSNMSIIGVIQQYNADPDQRPIWNAFEEKLSVATTMIELGNVGGMSVYPNPFNNFTNISFNLKSSADVVIRAFDVMGKEVAMIHAGNMPAGKQNIEWDAAGLSNGVYFIKVTAGTETSTTKVVLTR